ncbi:MAG: bifunctional diaminohydroxyphosphoribosylaminopyrimidine deaminase/5-amino-6-(5-phosphoribosylamino)uracil reductase RibD [Bacteroidetes bacterium]|nr:MAG: bifunctional diaminohydroxyphosphoribosylaminopyrimidine deaminase/5-amino-6-(5-phosphoribosylamino)uracil reductase RibD [Bacteroidota bacterium]
MVKDYEAYMKRCLQLASAALGQVAPNPLVGALLVHQGRIIGEGYHEKFGGPHAEVNCLTSVAEADRKLISESTMFVSLEPCAHFGKTPPCADRIIKEQIPHVVIGCRDPFPEVDGKGIEKMRAAGIDVEVGILEKECWEMNRRFFVFHTRHRPYIILKWAQTSDGFMANEDYSRLYISNELTNKVVHKWRSEEASILVGTRTALFDDPELSTRNWPGKNPIRLVIDMDLSLPTSLKLFNGEIPTIVFNQHRNNIEELDHIKLFRQEHEGPNLFYYEVTKDSSLVHQIMNALYHLKIQSVIVEGGARILQSFIEEDCWDEARVITNEEMKAGSGIAKPQWDAKGKTMKEKINSDLIEIFRNR